MKIGVVHPIVEDVLEAMPLTRGSDDLLYIEVCKRMADPHIMSMSFEKVLQYRANIGLPSMETVTRARRKIQENKANLRPTERVIEKRFENWKDVIDYATE